MNIETTISILGLLGVGGLLSSYFTFLWQRTNANKTKHQEYKESRYKCIIMLMHAYMNFEKNKEMLNKHGYDMKTRGDLTDLLRAECINSYLYATDGFIHALKAFIVTPSHENITNTALAIRKDLWGVKTKLKEPNQALQTTTMAVTDAAAQPPHQP